MSQFMNLIGQSAKKASLEKVNTKIKNKILKKYASLLDRDRNSIITENTKDIKFAIKIGVLVLCPPTTNLVI